METRYIGNQGFKELSEEEIEDIRKGDLMMEVNDQESETEYDEPTEEEKEEIWRKTLQNQK